MMRTPTNPRGYLALPSVAIFGWILAIAVITPAQRHLYTVHGDAASDYLGTAVAGIGDVNKDGFGDFAASTFRGRADNRGYVRIFSGRDGHELMTFEGDSANDNLGWSCDGAGDVNKDGFPDVIVGAHQDDPRNKANAGSAYVLSGIYIFNKIGKQVLYKFEGSTGDNFGRRARGAGDVNKDGHADVIIGAWRGGPGGSGYARVHSGKDGKVLWTFNSPAPRLYGSGVDGAGDVNKDGYADLIVGGHLGGANNGGQANVYSGKDGKILFTFNGDSSGDLFGFEVAGLGDVNLDTYPDVCVGASGDDNNGSGSGSVRVFSGKDGKVLATFNGDSAGDGLGWSVNAAGDVDKDGFPDVFAGATGDDNTAANAGAARVFSGRWILLKAGSPVLFTFNGDRAGDALGVSVSPAGDVNNDGNADIIAGAWFEDTNGTSAGMARVWSGRSLTLTSDSHLFSVAKANTQTLALDAGVAHKNRSYWIFGSVTGTSPGVTIGGVTVPLNPDPWTVQTITFANSAALKNTRGTLDASGKATARIVGGPVPSPNLVGVRIHWAGLVYDQNTWHLGTNPVTLFFTK